MKVPEYWKKESTHMTPGINTLSVTGVSLLWGHMLGLISPWFIPLTFICIAGGFGNEVRRRNAN